MTENQTYNNEMTRAMTWLGQQPNVVIIGQAVECPGTGCYETLHGVPEEKKFELPVAENFQVGLALGAALTGTILPVLIVPRWNFLLCATDQIVNHLDKFVSMSDGGFNPRVIIRVAVGSENPVDQAAYRASSSTILVEFPDYGKL